MQPVSFKSRRAPGHGRARALQFAAAFTAVMATGLHAQEASSWQWRGTVYGWLSSMEMDTRFPSGAGGPTIEVDAETLVDNLDFVFMAALQGR